VSLKDYWLRHAVTFILVVSGMESGNHWARRPEE